MRPLVGGDQVGHHAQQGGLAAARGPEQRQEAAARDREIDIVERRDRAALAGEANADLFTGDRRRQPTAASLTGSPAMRVCHMTRGWVMSNGRRLVQQAAIVPDHDVARPPVVVIDPRRLAGEVDQLLQQLFGLLRRQA